MVEFDYRIIGILTLLLLLVIGIAIMSNMGGKVIIPTEFLSMQLGIG